MRRRRLRRVETVDFRKSEYTNYLELLGQHHELKKLKDDDAIMMRSSRGDQVVILHGFDIITDKKKHLVHQFLHSERLRLVDKSGWNGLMIADYARRVGIEFIGLPTFDQHLTRILKETFPEEHAEKHVEKKQANKRFTKKMKKRRGKKGSN